MLSADLGFAGAFDIIGGSTGGIYTHSATLSTRGGGMVTDLAGNRYVTINGAYHSSSFDASESSETIDLDPGPGVAATTKTAGLVKLDPSGAVVRTAPFIASINVHVTVAVDSSQNVYLVGDFYGTMDVDPGPGVVNVTSTAGGNDWGYYMVKLNSAGELQWARTLDANELMPMRIEVDGDGNLIVACSFTATTSDPPMDVDAGPGQFLIGQKGAYDSVVLKYSTVGDFVWARQFGNAGASQASNGPSLAVGPQGDVFVSGHFVGDLDLDPGAGVHIVSNSDATNDAYLVQLNADGNYVGSYVTEGDGSTTSKDIEVASDGSVILSGYFSGTVYFAPGSASLPLTSFHSNVDGFALKLNSDLTVAWARQFGGVGSTAVFESALDGDGNVYLGGYFGSGSQPGQTSDFDPGPGVYERQFTTADYVSIVVNPLTATLAATADTYIDSGGKTTNFGGSSSLVVSGRPDDAALLKWDLSGLPAGSTLQSATLTIHVTNTSGNTYEIYELKRSWTESQSTWKKAASGSSWQIAGALGSLDHGTTVLGTVTASATGTRNVVLYPAGLAVVQGWIDNPASNFGVILQDYANANKDPLEFSSKEATVAADRPQLQVVYHPPSLTPSSLGRAVPTASLLGSSDGLATNRPASSSYSENFSETEFVIPGLPAMNANLTQSDRFDLAALPSQRLSSNSVDSAIAELGKDDSVSRGDAFEDGLLLELASLHT